MDGSAKIGDGSTWMQGWAFSDMSITKHVAEIIAFWVSAIVGELWSEGQEGLHWLWQQICMGQHTGHSAQHDARADRRCLNMHEEGGALQVHNHMTTG